MIEGWRKAWRQPETKLVFVGAALNGVWEFAHSPLFDDHDRGLAYVLWTRLHCTAGDVMILLAAYWVTALVWRSRRWPSDSGVWPAVVFVAIGLGYAVFSEWYNTTVRQAWQYAEAMPTIWGIGLTPLLQWLVLPPMVLRVARCATFRAGR